MTKLNKIECVIIEFLKEGSADLVSITNYINGSLRQNFGKELISTYLMDLEARGVVEYICAEDGCYFKLVDTERVSV